MDFYTNIAQRGDKIYVRGVKNNKRFQKEIKYRPYVFLPNENGKWKTLDNKSVDKLEFDSISDAKDYIKQYSDVVNFEIYGLTTWPYLYIYDNYPGEIQYDPEQILIYSLDIEVDSEDSWPNIKEADKEITAITIRSKGKAISFGCGDYNPPTDNDVYVKCQNEEDLLKRFLEAWTAKYPDIVTGWNCIPVDQSVWLENRIIKLRDLKHHNVLYDSKLINISPITMKEKYNIELTDGNIISTSIDHKFPVIICNKEKYTSFNFGKKENSFKRDVSLRDIIEYRNQGYEVFLEQNIRDNLNPDNLNYTNNQLYLAGLIFTDGTLKNKYKDSDGFSVSQSDFDLLNDINTKLNINGSIKLYNKGEYRLSIKKSILSPVIELIYNDKLKKELNVELLSSLSYNQFCSFVAGLLDGDGCVSKFKFGICNSKNEHLSKLKELFLWNGIHTSNANNYLQIFSSLKEFPILKNKRWNKHLYNRTHTRNSKRKSKNIRWIIKNNKILTRIKSIVSTNELVEMQDIETNTHYFNSCGIRVHNCDQFDIPYLVVRIGKVLSKTYAEFLSPWGIIEKKTIEVYQKEVDVYTLFGISSLDYLPLYRKFSFTNQESYSLNFISQVVLKEKKLDYSEYGSLSSLHKNNFQKFMEYNARDTVLVDKLEEKLGFINQVLALSYKTKINYNDTFTTVRMWDVIIHSHLLEQGIVIPNKSPGNKTYANAGGYVKEPQLGLYKWIVSGDLKSSYPHQIMQYNISPETFIKKIYDFPDIDRLLIKEDVKSLSNFDASIAANGCLFSKDKQGFLPALMEKFYNERTIFSNKEQEAKKKYEENKTKELENDISRFHNMQWAIKIILNACYGACANVYFRWFDIDIAEAITLSGQLVIRWIEKSVNDYLNKILKTSQHVDFIAAMDTDSIYVVMDEIVKKMGIEDEEKIIKALDKFWKENIQKVIDKSLDDFYNHMNAFQPKIAMARENIANKGIFTGKKHYILNVVDEKGIRYNPPKAKIVGIEAVRSSTPAACRESIKSALKVIMNEDEDKLQKFISEFREKFMELSFEDVAFPRSIQGMDVYGDSSQIYKKGTPVQVKGSLIFNSLLKKHGIKTIPEIQNGDKIKFAYLKEPNPVHDTVISVLDILPIEFGLDNYIDREKQFQKSFVEPLKSITDVIGWTHEKVSTLEGFFS